MDDLSVCLSVCLYPLNVNLDMVETTLSEHFKTFKVSSETELKVLLKKEHIFCIVIGGNLQEKEGIIKIRKICSATPKIPCIMYGHASEQEFLFQLAKDGLDNFVTHGKLELLIEKLYYLKEQATFRIDLSELGIHLNQCTNYWTRKFLKFIINYFNFLKYTSVREISHKIGISTECLNRAVKKDCILPPKQWLLCLRNYYAAYLLDASHWSAKIIAQKCGFADELDFNKNFRKRTGITTSNFGRENNWREYPSFFLQNIKLKSYKTNSSLKLTSKNYINVRK